ncbi:hypothetical protein [Boudabousia liubingyangii]|uniref:hypothetical protein n=1 Tax=Boudabousia liubingyangii TaxID=1921764 RepID=UPI001E50DAD6|nr:hypothetical protein [Boudabousia liubingyangii]
MAGTQGLVTDHMPQIMKSLAGPEMSQMLASTMPEPSWQQAYAGWMKNLAQIITLALITINAIGYATLTNNGDIPFILTKNVKRSIYLTTGTITTWCASLVYAVLGATLTWIGTMLIFPRAPYLPVFLASLVWALEMMLISAFQLFAATFKQGIGGPLLAGMGFYLLISIAGVFEKIATYTPLGLSRLSNQISEQQSVNNWFIPVGSALLLLSVMFLLSIHRFNRKELS